MDKRHQARIKIVQELYSAHYIATKLPSEKATAIANQSAYIDSLIEKSAPKFAVDKIAPVDLSILRLAIFELMIEKKTPPKVIINEAVELAKELGGQKAPGFVNAVLGAIYTNQQHDATK